MTEENLQSQEQAPEKQTLEDLYKEFEPKLPAKEQPEAAKTTAPNGNDTAILTEFNSLKAEIEADKLARAREKEDKDFKSAVATLAKSAGLEGKDTILKGFLLGKATEDERLRTLWENRSIAPKTWEAALELLAEEAKSQITVTDPQLEENQRAMEDSQRTRSATAPQAPTQEQDIMKMSDGEFDFAWQSLIRGN